MCFKHKMTTKWINYLSAAPGTRVLVVFAGALDDGGVQQLEHVRAAQIVVLAAVVLVVARTTHNLT